MNGMEPPPLDRLIAAAEAAADVAGAVIRPFFRAGLAADVKPDRSPVTIADRSAEQAMRAVLAERFPESRHSGRGVRARPARGAVALGARSDRRHARLHHRPPDVRHADRPAGRRPADPRRDRPAGHRRALGRRRRPADPIPPARSAGARAAGAARCSPTPNCPAPRRHAGRGRPALAAPGRVGAPRVLGRRLLRLWAAGAGPYRRDRRVRHEAVGLGRAGAGDRGRRRPHHRLVRPAPARRTATAGCWRWAIRTCWRRPLRFCITAAVASA